MKQLTIILLGLIGIAYGQSAPTSAKTRFVNGLYVGTKLDAYFAAPDSNAIYWRADSVLRAKYKGVARTIAFTDALGSYKLIADTFFTNGYTTRARTKQVIDSLGANKLSRSDSATYFSNVVRTFGNQTVGGNKTFSNDIVVNGASGVTVGRGNNSVVSNTVVGFNSLTSITSGAGNTAIGNNNLSSTTTASNNVSVGNNALQNNITGGTNNAFGSSALTNNTDGSSNIAIGQEAARFALSSGSTPLTSVNNSTYIGFQSRASSATGVTNETVIGYGQVGNGSNTVTIGNSSVTNNYFSGNIRSSNGTAFLKNIAVGSSSDSVLVTNNGEVRRVLQSSIGSGAYVDLTTNQTVGGIKTFTNQVTSEQFIFTRKNGSNTVGAGGYLGVGQESDAKQWLFQINGSQGLDFWHFNGSSWITPITVASSGSTTFNYPINGTSLSMSGEGLFGGATTDGLNKLIVNGGVKGNSNIYTETTNAQLYALDGTIKTKVQSQSAGATQGVIGTESNHDLAIVTNNVARLTIASTGAITASSSVTATQYRLSALNTAPSSASDTGTLGEIRIDANYIYVCTATNTWKRVAIATW